MHIQYAFLDSGVGGMPYFSYFHAQAPTAHAVYIADTMHFPYGEKSTEEIISYAYHLSEKIIAQFHPDVIVIACNTMSVAALAALRERYTVPFIGTVPAVKLAAVRSVNKRIGIIATERTIHDPYLDKLAAAYAADCTIEKRADTLLVSQIENGLALRTTDEQKQAILPALQQFTQAGIDTLVLACTHFLHIADIFTECAAPHITVVDSREGVVKQTLKIAPPIAVPDQPSYCYITGALSQQVDAQYRSLCKQFHLQWCGVLP
ncbi:MAG: glutamate racemase [Treponema sp.]